MKAEALQPETLLPTADLAPAVVYRDIAVSLRSRLALRFLRTVLKPRLALMATSNKRRIARLQLRVSALECPDTAGLALDYRVLERVPGHVLGALDERDRPVVLWLHGGAFVLPAAPTMHLVAVARLSRELGASAFLPDYRLAPFNPFPAGLDDCEQAYRILLERGHPPSKIVLGGDSAGGNLALALLQRIRKAGLPMPACAIVVSPVTELGRVHSPPSRHRRMKADPLLPAEALQRINELYAGGHDTADPELSPLYMDCRGLPPMFFLASDAEILVDDTVMLAERVRAAGVPVSCHVWPAFPHSFPLFEHYFPEVAQARQDIAEFAARHLR